MTARNEIEIDDVTDLRVVNGVIELPANARIKGLRSEVWLRIANLETAEHLVGRLTAGIAAVKLRTRYLR